MREEKQETLVEIAVPQGQEGGTRLDVYLTNKLANATRAKVQRGIKEGRVDVNGVVQTKPSAPVQPGDQIVCRILRPPPIEVIPEAIPLDVVYEDDWLLIVNKPAGMVVH
ncbi:MAG: RluA family pseudouridine synthase, partial [Rhodothermaceae bacterium]|nr:RluA family pseudouridine synthase [Rhodothermaceae bacterium]